MYGRTYPWLTLAACRYLTSTADTGLLDESVHFVERRELNPNEDSYYDLPTRSTATGTLYEHCVRAFERGLNCGVHGLPSIGSCDWNDGMGKVEEHGKGECVWLAFFLYDVLTRFAVVAKIHGDAAFAERCIKQTVKQQKNIEANAWDGKWYSRAYFDDGTPLGSSANAECQIDSISQRWSVLSGAGEAGRSKIAMDEVNRRLVQRDSSLIQLLTPPFDSSALNPGYIRGCVPCVRENGGQYTRAAVWTAMAFAKMGDGERAWELAQVINPINRSADAAHAAVYKAEPYLMAADVYAVAPHVGRGGWTWYTASAGWIYRLLVESLLGLHLEANTLIIKACMPAKWQACKLAYRYGGTMYRIEISPHTIRGDVQTMRIDGMDQADGVIHLIDDAVEHYVDIRC